MKKTLATLATLAAIALFATPAHAATYPATMKVTAINPATDVVTMETATGHVYEMTGVEDYLVGDLVSLIMDDKGTTEITDDEILSARYAGWWIEDGHAYVYEE